MLSHLKHRQTQTALTAILLCWVLTACAPVDLQVTEPRVRDLIGNRDTTAGYFTLHNPTAEAVVLVGASSPHARAIEMHETIERDGSVRMRRLQQITVAPGETFAFVPGGPHLMIFGVHEMPERFTIELTFAQREPLSIDFSRFGP